MKAEEDVFETSYGLCVYPECNRQTTPREDPVTGVFFFNFFKRVGAVGRFSAL